MNPDRSVSPGRTVRVLVVDDDPRVRAGLAGLLTATPGLAVPVSTGSATRALAVASRGRADVGLVDVLLPTPADGLRLVRDLSAYVPVVAMSLDGVSRDSALRAGALAFVEKDGAIDELVAAVLAVAGSSRRQGRGP